MPGAGFGQAHCSFTQSYCKEVIMKQNESVMVENPSADSKYFWCAELAGKLKAWGNKKSSLAPLKCPDPPSAAFLSCSELCSSRQGARPSNSGTMLADTGLGLDSFIHRAIRAEEEEAWWVMEGQTPCPDLTVVPRSFAVCVCPTPESSTPCSNPVRLRLSSPFYRGGTGGFLSYLVG